ncbi:Uu.00g022440.m01.CDS01 [Anthostomella pinea]|uniref:Uu.00g022440.m01.CDS01 n=1 Tax=Anthostomella pinea TaxID=933095 RepID=A0AAI8W0D7_9PEZI|nr:Uu.00g022440.m01.CDS01 [Anthostomella pinea]
MPKKQATKQDGPSAAAASDPRFASFETNPRFRLPSKGRSKTKIDKRFAHMLKDKDFIASAKVDKYGRKLKSDNKRKALQNIYEPEDDEGAEVEDDDVVQQELENADTRHDPARGGGFSSSESESDSDEEDGDGDEGGGPEVAASGSMQKLRDEEANVETGEVTKRIAIVNLDWDHIKSADLMALFSSFVPKGGRIERVSVYPSEFGKERMQREELEGPPREIFKKSAKDDAEESEPDSEDDSGVEDEDEDDEDEDEDEQIKKDLLQEGDDQDFDSDALRSYQLDRLRYYYAVMVCSDTATAAKVYQSTDGTEYQTSSNFIDLRFVPDNVTFDDEPRDECDSLSADYKPTEFVTDALQHSKVKLTWDMHPDEVARRENIQRAFTGSRQQLEENDMRAYLASDSEDDIGPEEDEGEEADVADDQPKLTKKELKAQKLREALGLGSAPVKKTSEKAGPVGDMLITFSAALMDDSDKKKKKEPETEETTIEKYKRKERERKERKKEIAVAKRGGVSDEVPGDEPAEAGEDDLGFDDPFFTTEEAAKPSKTSERKEERRKRRDAKNAEAAEKAAEKAHLEKIMADDSEDGAVEHLDHFDMNEISRAEKKKSKKYKKKGKKDVVQDHGGLQEGFAMDVDDNRFKAVFESHEFAIDPSNPKYKATPGMKVLLEEGRKKRKNDPEDAVEPSRDGGKAKKQKTKPNDDLTSLVESVRRKARSKA